MVFCSKSGTLVPSNTFIRIMLLWKFSWYCENSSNPSKKSFIETFSFNTISLTSSKPDIAQDSTYPDTIPPLMIGFVHASP